MFGAKAKAEALVRTAEARPLLANATLEGANLDDQH
jgi:hypothetical protein